MSVFGSEWQEREIVNAFEKVRYSHRQIVDTIGFSYGVSATLTEIVAARVYTEYCMERDKVPDLELVNYCGQGLDKFLNDEKLFEAINIRRGKNRIAGNYPKERERILDAFARSALDFFVNHCERKGPLLNVKEGDKTNIRRSLQPWLDNPNLVSLS